MLSAESYASSDRRTDLKIAKSLTDNFAVDERDTLRHMGFDGKINFDMRRSAAI